MERKYDTIAKNDGQYALVDVWESLWL